MYFNINLLFYKRTMFITNTVVNNYIIDRSFFSTLSEAVYHAKTQSKEKIWKLPDNSVYFGDVEVKVYKPNLCVTSDHRDEHILSFVDP